MGDFLPLLIQSAPGAAVGVVIVVLFLRHEATHDKLASKTMREIAIDCHNRQRESQASFERSLAAVIDVHRESTVRVEKKLDEVVATNRAMELSVTRLVGSLERPYSNGSSGG